MKIIYKTINKFSPQFLPGDKVWEIDPEGNPRELIIGSVECFYASFRYNILSPKETPINWFTEDYVDILEKRETYPASAVWTTKDKLLNSYIFWHKREWQAKEMLNKINLPPTP